MAGKQPMNIRLSDAGRDLLDEISKAKGISRTAIIELAIRDYAEAQGYRPRQDAAPEETQTARD